MVGGAGTEIRRIRYDREAAIRRRLSNLSIEDAPQPTVGPEAAEAIATAVLDTVLIREAPAVSAEADSAAKDPE
jgi:hypothetical protein